MRYAAIVASSLLVVVSLVSFETPARASNDDFAYVRGQADAYQRGREDEWRRHQSEGDGYRPRREYNQNWRLGQRVYAPDYGVDSATYNGLNSNQSAYFARSGAQGFTVSGGTSPPSVVDPPVVTPPATGTPRAQLLAYLQSLSGNHTLIGQTSNNDNGEFNADTQAFGFSPAIMFNDPWAAQWAGNAPFWTDFMPAALAHAKAGGIVGMSLVLPNPVDHGPSMSGPAVDPVQLLTPGSALNNSLNGELDQAAGLLQQFKDAGDAVLTRFMMELDGGWFWWGDGHFSNAQQTQLFRYIVNYLRVTKGLDNLLTTFAVNGGPGDYEYPGDDVVDIVGIDAYTNSLAGTYKGVYDKLISQAPTKVFALTEFGSGGPSAADPSYDLNRLKTDIQSALPRAVYANFWPGWGPDQQVNGKAAMSEPFWINKSQVMLPAPPPTPPVDPTPPTPSRSDTDHFRHRPRQSGLPDQ
jgi:hypothetical protein